MVFPKLMRRSEVELRAPDRSGDRSYPHLVPEELFTTFRRPPRPKLHLEVPTSSPESGIEEIAEEDNSMNGEAVLSDSKASSLEGVPRKGAPTPKKTVQEAEKVELFRLHWKD